MFSCFLLALLVIVVLSFSAMSAHVPLSSLWVDVVRALEMSDEARALEMCPSLLTHCIELDVNEYVPASSHWIARVLLHRHVSCANTLASDDLVCFAWALEWQIVRRVSDELRPKISSLKVACVHKSVYADADEKRNAERQLQDISLSPDQNGSESESAPKDTNELDGRVFIIRSKKFHKTITVSGASQGQASLKLQTYEYADHQHFELKQVVRSTKPCVSSRLICNPLKQCYHQT
jgi:hypothetical protein